MKTPLSRHTSPETAYLVDDYPYGFRLRCKIRYWLEFKPGKGFRFVSQTSNPKRDNAVWNKPKASTYSRFGGVMLLDDANGHVTWDGLSEYDDARQCLHFLTEYGHTMPADAVLALRRHLEMQLEYQKMMQAGAVSITTTTTKFISLADLANGARPAVESVKTTVLKPDYSPEEVKQMQRSVGMATLTMKATQ